MRKVPDHSTFSQNRRRRFQEVGIFRGIFKEIVLKCIEFGIVSGEIGVADGSFLLSNVSWDSLYGAVEMVQQSTVKYMEELETELSSMPGYKKTDRSKEWLYPSGSKKGAELSDGDDSGYQSWNYYQCRLLSCQPEEK